MNVANMKDFGNYHRASSLTMTHDRDAIVLYTRRNYRGPAYYLSGVNRVPYMLMLRRGAQIFNENIYSVRHKPFKFRINFAVITGKNGELPGPYTSREDLRDDLIRCISNANEFFTRNKTLITVQLSDVHYRRSERYFHMNLEQRDKMPAVWKKSGMIDVLVCDTIELASGIAPSRKSHVTVAADRSNVNGLSRTLTHELGHYWGLSHGSAKAALTNLMTVQSDRVPLNQALLHREQIETIHNTIANNSRKRSERR